MIEEHKVCVIIYRTLPEQKKYRFLLLRRVDAIGGYWQPVTGTVEQNESLRTAAARELKEETGLGNNDVALHSTPFHEFRFQKNDRHFKEHVFCAETSHRYIELRSEHSDYTWLPYSEAMETLYWDSNKEGLHTLYLLLTT